MEIKGDLGLVLRKVVRRQKNKTLALFCFCSWHGVLCALNINNLDYLKIKPIFHTHKDALDVIFVCLSRVPSERM